MFGKNLFNNGMRPVQQIEVPQGNVKKRAALAIALAAIAICAFGIAIYSALSKPSGWTDIEARRGSPGCAGEFTFRYCLDEKHSSAQYKTLSALYTSACERAQTVFGEDALAALSGSVNSPVAIEPELYDAIRLIRDYGCRIPYLAPLYEVYGSVFFCTEDEEIILFDPAQDSDTAAFFSELSYYINDPKHVDITLYEDGRAMLTASEEYLEFARENGCVSLYDLSWMKNAFIIDALAATLRENGFTHGYIQSYDGYIVDLCGSEESFTMSIFDRNASGEFMAARMEYTGPASFAALRSYSLNPSPADWYYEKRDGEILSIFVDPSDCVPKTSVNDLLVWSSELGCGELVLRAAPVFISDVFEPQRLVTDGMDRLYCENGVIVCSAGDVSFSQTGEGYSVSVR